MKEREGGFFVTHRRLWSSPVYMSLTGEQRSVFHTLLYLANWKDNPVMLFGEWHTIKRGELFHSLSTIAKASNVSIKVVRGAIEKLLADDSQIGGRGPFLRERTIFAKKGTTEGTTEGKAHRVLTIVNYCEYQDIPEMEGTPKGTPKGTEGAHEGHRRGTEGAPNEQREQGEQGKQKDISDADASATPKPSPEADAPKRVRKLSAAQEFANKLLAKRAATFPVECPPVDVVVLNQLLGGLLKRFGEVGVETAWSRYLADAHWKAEGCPLNAFLSPKVHLRFFQSGPLPQAPKVIDLSAIPAATNLYPDAPRSPNGNDQR